MKFKKKEQKKEERREAKQEIKPEVTPVIPVNASLFVTTDARIVQKLQDMFTIKSVNMERVLGEEVLTYTFNATVTEVENFLKGD